MTKFTRRDVDALVLGDPPDFFPGAHFFYSDADETFSGRPSRIYM